MPLPPVTAGLILCLQADTFTLSDGAATGSWVDQSSAGNAATVAGSPHWYQGLAPNGLSGVQFNGDGDYTFSNNTMLSGATSGELFVVVRSLSTNTDGPFCLGGNDAVYYPYSDGRIYDGAFTNTRYAFTPTVNISRWQVYNVSHDGTTRTARLGGVTQHTATVGFTVPSASGYSTLRVGHGGNGRGHARVAEVLVYNTALSSGDRTAVHDHLAARWLQPATTAPPPVTTGLVVHWQADAYAGGDNQYIRDSWPDVSGTANHGIMVGAAKQRTGRTPAGRRSVEFAGGGSGPYFTFTTNTILNPPTTAAEVFLVVKSGSTNNPAPFSAGGADGFFPHPSGVGSNSIYDGTFEASGQRRNFANPGVGGWGIYHVSSDGATKICRYNGVVLDTATVGYTAPSATNRPNLILGWPVGLFDRFAGEIAEVVVFNRALTTGERSDVFAFLNTRHITGATVGVDPPAASTQLGATPPGIGFFPHPPAASIHLSCPAPALADPPSVTAPPASLTMTAAAPVMVTATITLLSPTGGPVIPSLRPLFVVAVVSTEPDLVVQVQVDDHALFTTPTTLSVAVPPGQAIAQASVRAVADLADDTEHWWRARATNPFDATGWTDPDTFSTSSADGDALIGGLWKVSAGAVPTPHLWFVHPPRGAAGDHVAAVGRGFGPTTATATLAGLSATVTSFTTVAPSADAYTADRVIDADAGTSDPGHQVVAITVPDAPYPGGNVIVDGS